MSSESSKPAVGVIGLGDLGSAISFRLRDCGHRVVAHDRNASLAHSEAADGVQFVDSISSLAQHARTVCVVVSDAEAVREVVAGAGGVLASSSPPETLLLMSTVDPHLVRELASSVDSAETAFVEVAVSGGSERARSGDLVLMCGGPADLVDGVRPLLDRLGSMRRIGDYGSAQIAKLANNLVLGGTRLLVIEALALSSAYGIDEQTMLGLLEAGTADAWVIRNWRDIDSYCEKAVERGDAEILAKDVAAAVGCAAEIDLVLPVSKSVVDSIVQQNVARFASPR